MPNYYELLYVASCVLSKFERGEIIVPEMGKHVTGGNTEKQRISSKFFSNTEIDVEVDIIHVKANKIIDAYSYNEQSCLKIILGASEGFKEPGEKAFISCNEKVYSNVRDIVFYGVGDIHSQYGGKGGLNYLRVMKKDKKKRSV